MTAEQQAFIEMRWLPFGPCQATRTVSVKYKPERDERINAAMKALYEEGCRRMRVISLPVTGDYRRYRVMGWHG